MRIAVPSLVYSDSAGHALRSVTWGFDGTMIGTDIVYDAMGRTSAAYQPRFITDSDRLSPTNVAPSGAVLAVRNHYDDLSRIIQTEVLEDRKSVV